MESDDLMLNIFVARKDAANLSQIMHSGIYCIAEKRRMRTDYARPTVIGNRQNKFRN